MSFLLSLVGFFQVLSVQVSWVNDFIQIPLKESAYHYQFLPEAHLYIDGVLVIDPERYYERDRVEWTFMSTVNTGVVRSYGIKQRVYFPTYQVVHVHTITFNIVDLIAPQFMHVPHYKITVGEKMPNLKEGVILSDNYDPIESLTLTISTTHVVLSRIGTYPIFYQVSDQSGNVSFYTSSIEIYDHLAPTITPKKALQIAFGESLVWQNFFDIKDNYDAFPTVHLNLTYVDMQTIGQYPIEITASDASGNTTTHHATLSIVDLKAPEIKFRTVTPILVHSEITEALMKSFILSVSDNYDHLSIDDVLCDHDIDPHTLGEYFIYYEVTDRSQNRLSTKLKVRISDFEKPKITLIEPLIFDVFSPEPMLMRYFEFDDNHTAKHDLVHKFVGTYKMHVVGKYLIRVEVTDASKNMAVYQTYLEVVDQIPPEVTQLNDIIITEFEKKSLSHYFTVKDNYDPSSVIKMTIDDQHVTYDIIGRYIIYVKALDQSHNESIFESEVIIIDIEDPVLILKAQQITVEVNSSPLDLTSFIHQVSDNYDLLTAEDVRIVSFINYQKVGRYDVYYRLKDTSQNETVHILYVIVDDIKPPTLEVTHLRVAQHTHVQLDLGVDIADDFGDVYLYYFPQTIDTSIPGKKTVTYVAMDARGNYVIKERIIEVMMPDVSYRAEDFIPIILVTLLGGAAIFYFYKRM